MGAGGGACPPGQVTPGGGGGGEPGWAKLAAAVAAGVPPAEIETIYLFRPIKREGREGGTAGGTRRPPGGAGGGYTAKDMLGGRGKGRGEGKGAGGEGGRPPA